MPRLRVRVREVVGERLQPLGRGLVVGELPGRTQLALDGWPVAPGGGDRRAASRGRRRADRRADGLPGAPRRAEPAHASQRWPAAQARAVLFARALGRPPAARRGRPRAGLRARRADRGRAQVLPRRVGPSEAREPPAALGARGSHRAGLICEAHIAQVLSRTTSLSSATWPIGSRSCTSGGSSTSPRPGSSLRRRAIPTRPRCSPPPRAATRATSTTPVLEGDVPSPIDIGTGCAFAPRCPFAVDRCCTDAQVLRPAAGAAVVAC